MQSPLSLRWVALAVALTVFGFAAFGESARGEGKEFEIDGSIDCSARSGRDCQDLNDNLLSVWTDDVTGEMATVKIDVGWVLDDLATLRQDRTICLIVRDEDGTLRAVGVPDICDELGNGQPGRLVPQPDGGRAAEKDEQRR